MTYPTIMLTRLVREIADSPHPWIPGSRAQLIKEIATKLEEYQALEEANAQLTERVADLEAIESLIENATRGFAPHFKVGERVELVARPGRGANRPGVVKSLDDEFHIRTSLNVLFDDGEERHINPDVMRREGGRDA